MNASNKTLMATLTLSLALLFGALGTATAGDGKSCGGKKDGDKSAAIVLHDRAVA